MASRKPNILALETSSPRLSVALKAGPRPVTQRTVEGFFEHAENLLALIDRLLMKARLKACDIDIFMIGRGPGSFTGLRVGFATLKGFLAVRPKKCFGALSIDLAAAGIPVRGPADLCLCMDARRQKLYSRLYRPSALGWRPAGRVRVTGIEELCADLPKNTLLAGDGLRRYRETLEHNTKHKNICFLPEKFWYPKASALIIGYDRDVSHKAGSRLLKDMKDPRDFVPLYFRASEPEEKRRIRDTTR